MLSGAVAEDGESSIVLVSFLPLFILALANSFCCFCTVSLQRVLNSSRFLAKACAIAAYPLRQVVDTFSCLFSESHKPVAGGGRLGGAVPPQQEIKLNLCPTKLKFALAYFNHIYRSYK